MEFPPELKYTRDHEWIDATKDSAHVGISAYALEQLGDIVHVELPDVGETFGQGDAFGTIESTKAVSDLYMPVNGTIQEVNKRVVKTPSLVQEDPYNDGWLVKIKVLEGADNSQLFTSDAYEDFIQKN